MKMTKPISLLMLTGFLLVGCGHAEKAVYTAGGGALGGGLAYALFDKKPIATAIGAVAGATLSSAIYGKDRKAIEEGYREGYIKASSDSIKRQYWLKQELERSTQSDAKMSYYSFPADTRGSDGRMLVDHQITVPILE